MHINAGFKLLVSVSVTHKKLVLNPEPPSFLNVNLSFWSTAEPFLDLTTSQFLLNSETTQWINIIPAVWLLLGFLSSSVTQISRCIIRWSSHCIVIKSPSWANCREPYRTRSPTGVFFKSGAAWHHWLVRAAAKDHFHHQLSAIKCQKSAHHCHIASFETEQSKTQKLFVYWWRKAANRHI